MTDTTDKNSERFQALRAKDRQVQKELMQVSDKVRARHPFLVKHQNAVGMGIFLVSIAGMVLNGVLWLEGIMPAWLCTAGGGTGSSADEKAAHVTDQRPPLFSARRVSEAQ